MRYERILKVRCWEFNNKVLKCKFIIVKIYIIGIRECII